MSSPMHCDACGHALGIGRFCTNCGRPVPGRHPEAVPLAPAPASPPASVPPAAGDLPPAARYPLFADEGTPTQAPVADVAVEMLPGFEHSPAPRDGGGRRPWVGWVAGAAAIAVIAGVGVVLLTGGDDDGRADDRAPSASPSVSDGGPRATEGSGGNDGTDGTDGADDGDGPRQVSGDDDVEAPDPDDVVDLSSEVKAKVPGTAKPSRDTENRKVTFRARNMWDQDPRTCWRVAGDATGDEIVFDLGDDAVLTEVGLINGYAKVDGPNDWYPSNRRVQRVEWEFDGGRTVTQDLTSKRTMQSIAIEPVATSKVTLRFLEVSAPGRENGRDFTAVSEIRLLGASD